MTRLQFLGIKSKLTIPIYSPKHLTKCKCGKYLKEKPLVLALLRAQNCTWISFFGANVRKRKITFKHRRVFHSPQPLLCPLLESIISIGLKTFFLAVKSFLTLSKQTTRRLKSKIQRDHHQEKGWIQLLDVSCQVSTLSLR